MTELAEVRYTEIILQARGKHSVDHEQNLELLSQPSSYLSVLPFPLLKEQHDTENMQRDFCHSTLLL